MKNIAALFCLFALSACTLAPHYSTPPVETPGTWANGTTAPSSTIPQNWWELYGSPELNALQTAALANNTDVEAAIQRVNQARAQVRIANSTLFPSVDANGNVGRELSSGGKPHNNKTNISAGATVGYEADLFGGNRANRQATEESYRATAFDRDSTNLVVTTDVATNYFTLLSLRQRLQVATDNLANAQQVLTITQARFNAGTLSNLEVTQQQSAVASTQASLASLQQQVSTTTDALGVLLGKAPNSVVPSATTLAALSIPQISATQPSALLTRRPDIQVAEANLKAANADVGAARAALFPQLNLSADAALAFNPTTSAINAGAGLLAPIFHGGSLLAAVDLSKARKAELVANYRKTVLTSFQEVEDALAGVSSASTRRTQLQIAADSAKTAADLSRLKYNVGSIDFPTLLATQQTQLSSDDALIQARLDQLTASLQLIKALGGGWELK